MESEELKPCPFCGGKAKINYERIPGSSRGCWAQVICEKCHGRSAGTWENTYSTAEKKEVKKWNCRASNEEMVEKLRNTSFERYGNDGMGGEQVVNLDDAIEIVMEKENRQ